VEWSLNVSCAHSDVVAVVRHCVGIIDLRVTACTEPPNTTAKFLFLEANIMESNMSVNRIFIGTTEALRRQIGLIGMGGWVCDLFCQHNFSVSTKGMIF